MTRNYLSVHEKGPLWFIQVLKLCIQGWNVSKFLEENPLNLRICVKGENVPVPQRTVVGVQLLFLLCIFAIKVLECLSLKRMTFHSILITSS